VPACEQSINGSPDKHQGVVRATRVLCSRETRCSAARWGDTSTRTRASTLACSLSRARACGWTGRAEGFDSSGVRVCICADVGSVATGATHNRRRVHGDNTETRAQRADLGEAVFRVEVAERFELGVDGSTTLVRRCVGVRGDGTAECRVRSQIGEAGARPLGCVRMCVCRTPTARPWQRHEIDGVH
jgi:hypothetical protein